MRLSEDLLKHIKDKKGVVLVAGRPGMGKTTLLLCFKHRKR